MIEAGRYCRTPDGVGKVLTTNGGLGGPTAATTATVVLFVGGPQLTRRGMRTYALDVLEDLGASTIRAKIELTLDRYEEAAGNPDLDIDALIEDLISDLRTLAMEAT